MKRCIKCDRIINWDGSDKFCLTHHAEHELTKTTGLSMEDLPDGLPIEDYVDEEGNLDFDGISSW